MSFYKSKSGITIDGSAESAHVAALTIIPDNTSAPAAIKKIEFVQLPEGKKFYEITYKILDGDFKGYETRQKIDPFQDDAKKCDRALNMLMRLYLLCGHTPMHENAPTTQELSPLVGHTLGIVIRQWFFNDKEGNFIAEIYCLDANFITRTGKLLEPKQSKPTKIETYGKQQVLPMADDDVPF